MRFADDAVYEPMPSGFLTGPIFCLPSLLPGALQIAVSPLGYHETIWSAKVPSSWSMLSQSAVLSKPGRSYLLAAARPGGSIPACPGLSPVDAGLTKSVRWSSCTLMLVGRLRRLGRTVKDLRQAVGPAVPICSGHLALRSPSGGAQS